MSKRRKGAVRRKLMGFRADGVLTVTKADGTTVTSAGEEAGRDDG